MRFTGNGTLNVNFGGRNETSSAPALWQLEYDQYDYDALTDPAIIYVSYTHINATAYLSRSHW